MRSTSVFLMVAFSGVVACVADPGSAPGSVESAVAGAVTAIRTTLEANFDSVLRANGSACGFDLERQRTACVVTTVTTPPRRLQIGDAIPSIAVLNICWVGGGCAPIVPVPATVCIGLPACLPVAAGCKGDFGCKPSPDGSPGHEIICTCSD